MKTEYAQRIDELFLNYANCAKPLMSEIASRHKDRKLPRNLLNEIRAFNDHIARCYREDVGDPYVDSELRKAEGHLRRLLYDCFKQLNIYISDKIKHTERWKYSYRWLYHNGGDFWHKYTEWKRNAQKYSIEAKKQESINSDAALKYFELAYHNYRKIEELFKDNREFLVLSSIIGFVTKAFQGIWWIIVTVLLSVVAVVIEHFFF